MSTLQQGIYHGPARRPPGHFALVFLRADPEADAAAVDAALRRITEMLRGLADGRVPELPGHPVPTGELEFLLGFGPKAFAIPDVKHPCPDALGPRFLFRSPAPPGAARCWSAGACRTRRTSSATTPRRSSASSSPRRPSSRSPAPWWSCGSC
ncbi:hypothetical protein WKI68_37960 [Streptomyces sp. MS1.HAVA.3]|uniref:Uncharacterized protein n=1 Tax=Streptomyces caledonius TaxID=3134107 RepID=A0ABU8UC50_9ACTN